eukprot:gene7093-7895_t
MATQFTFGGFNAKTTSASTGFGVATTNTGFTFGTPATSKPAGNLFGGFGTTTASTSATPSFFGAPTTTAGFGATFGGFGSATKTTASGLFGTSTSTSAFGFPSTNAGGGLFGGTSFGAKTTSSTGLTLAQPTTAFATLQQQNATQQASSNSLNAMTNALTMTAVFGDERDAILTKLNQMQALWGHGKGYYAKNQQPVDFNMDNPFCRFKSIGYSCLPNAKNSDGLVALDLKHKIDYVKNNQQQLVESLHKVLGSKPTLVVCVDGVKELPDEKTEVIFYVVERAMNGTSRRIPATELHAFLSQDNIKKIS